MKHCFKEKDAKMLGVESLIEANICLDRKAVSLTNPTTLDFVFRGNETSLELCLSSQFQTST